METFVRTFKGVRVTFRVCEEDLPREYWEKLIADVSFVVSRNPVGRTLTVIVCSADFSNDKTYGFTEGKAFTHIHVNPWLYTHRNFIVEDVENLNRAHRNDDPNVARKVFMPVWDHINLARYTFAHEYGHRVTIPLIRGDFPKIPYSSVLLSQMRDSDALSAYGFDPVEGLAEGYAEWSLTNGQTRNRWARDVMELIEEARER